MKKILIGFFVIALFISNISFSYAEDVSVNLTMRNGNEIIFSDSVTLPAPGVISLNDVDGNNHDIDAYSVLSAINSADILSGDFEISNLTYFSSFGSLYLKCITDGTGESCDDWQYVVDGSYPYSSMDQNILSGGENIYVYFGPQNKITLSSNSINTNDILNVTAQAYDYENNNWVSRDGVTIGLTQPNPNDPFSPTEILISEVDENGIASFSNIPIGSYNVGVKEDYYFPTEELEVINAPIQNNNSGSSGGSNKSNKKKDEGQILGANTEIKFDIEKAWEFLYTQQKENGSFGENIFTDWASIALAIDQAHKNESIKLIKYLSENNISGTMLTDYERHAMALMSLGLNPYNTNGENYIKKITDTFDGKQFGDINEDNDDIFALIVLQNAGYDIEDIEILNPLKFILERQNENGSWDGSIDMTGACISALAGFQDRDDVKNSLSKAKEFLKKNQNKDGGFENVSSTAWAMEGILALGEKSEDWVKNENTPNDFLAINQDTDGGIKNEDLNNKLWQTSYVLKALSNKTWNQVMQDFKKKEIEIVKIIEKPKVVPMVKKTIVKIPENKTPIKNLEEITTQNTAEAINAIKENEQKKPNFFARVFKNIFGIFN